MWLDRLFKILVPVLVAGLCLLFVYGAVWTVWELFLIPVILEPFLCGALDPAVLREGYCP